MGFLSTIIVSLFFFAVAVHGQCSVDVRVIARAGQDSTWEEGGLKHQIYDIRVTNTGTCSIDKVTASITLAAGSSIAQEWNYEPASGEISLFQTMSAGQNEVYAGFVAVGTAIPVVASATPTCSQCSSQSTSAPSTPTPSTSAPTTSAPTTSAPTTSAPTTPAPTTSAPSTSAPTSAPSTNSTCTAYQGNYLSIAFSPSTGRYAYSYGSGGYRVGYSLQSCAGYPPTVNDCITLLVCVDCSASISISNAPVNGQYLASVATALTKAEAVERAFEHCNCLIAGTNHTCLRL